MSRQERRAAQNIQLATVEDLFGLDGDTANTGTENGITELPVEELHTFKSHSYKVIPDDEAMQELIESVTVHGILVPLEVRPHGDGGHEIISGHRRKFAAVQAGLPTVPCIISGIDDDTATLRMVDSNLYRHDILPSEKAFAYKMKLDAMSRTAGRPAKNGDQVGWTPFQRQEIPADSRGTGGRKRDANRPVYPVDLPLP